MIYDINDIYQNIKCSFYRYKIILLGKGRFTQLGSSFRPPVGAYKIYLTNSIYILDIVKLAIVPLDSFNLKN